MKQRGSDEYQCTWTTKHQSLLGNVFPAALFSLPSAIAIMIATFTPINVLEKRAAGAHHLNVYTISQASVASRQ
jgi:hypothetical protein